VYFSGAGEIDTGRVASFLAADLALEPLWDLFARLILQSHVNGLAPKNDPSVLAAFTAEEVAQLASLTELATETFATSDRAGAVTRLINEQKRNDIQQSIAMLKRQVQIAATQSPQDVPRYLSEVMVLTQNLSALERSSAGL
jgi:hypothetical protein